MKAIVGCLILLLASELSFAQQCRLVPVCDENANPNILKGDKGDHGAPGKAGPEGIGIPGSKGDKGEMGNCNAFREEIGRKLSNLEALLTPASCLTSSVFGVQTLRSGEEAFCDNGWTVFQHRQDGSENFDRPWRDYKSGFGNKSGEFWLGLEKIHSLTNGRGCRLRVDLWDFSDNQAYAEYELFAIESESDNYRLHVDGYSGNAGNSLMDNGELHNNQPFTTRDRDNDADGSENCALHSNGIFRGGWWFYSCFRASLNGLWGRSEGTWTKIVWFGWKGHSEALKITTMKLRCD